MAYKNKNIVRDGPFFTHFATLPFISPHIRKQVQEIQFKVREAIHGHKKYPDPEILREHHHEQCHLTLFKLVLRHNKSQQKMKELMNECSQLIKATISGLVVLFQKISYFTRFNKNAKCKEVTVIYGQIDQKSQQILFGLTDKLIRMMLKEEIIASNQFRDMNVVYDHNKNLYKPETLHISLFRARNLLQDQTLTEIFRDIQQNFKVLELAVDYFDISTMGKEYDHTNFYLPLHRIELQQEVEPQKKEKGSIKEQESRSIAKKKEQYAKLKDFFCQKSNKE